MTRHGWIRVFVRNLEGNPHTQYRVHRAAMRFWLVNAAVVVTVFFAAPGVWAKVSVLYLVLVSLYANWSTDFGAMSAAEAAAEGAVSEFAIEESVNGNSLEPDIPGAKEGGDGE